MEINIPAEAVSIGNSAFKNCGSLESITWGDSLKTIDGAVFCGCASLREIAVPDTVEELGGGVFKECVSLEKVKLSESLTTIGGYTFYNCDSLKEISIPGSIVNIDDYALSGCSSLSLLYFEGDAPSVGKGAFGSDGKGITIRFDDKADGWTSPTWTDGNGTIYNSIPYTEDTSDNTEHENGTDNGEGDRSSASLLVIAVICFIICVPCLTAVYFAVKKRKRI